MEIDEQAALSVGRIILAAAEIDAQLNAVCMEVFQLPESEFGLPLVATLDTPRKVEAIKGWAKHLKSAEWRSMLMRYTDAVEDIIRLRNIAAHSIYRPEGDKLSFASLGLAKLLKAMASPDKVTELRHLDEGFKKASETLEIGEKVYVNFQRVRAEMTRRYPPQPSA